MKQRTKWEKVRDRVSPLVNSRSRRRRVLQAMAAALRSEPETDAEDDLQAHGRAALFATALGEFETAESWLDACAERGTARSLTPGLSDSILAVRMAIRMNARRREEADRLFHAIDWSRTFPNGWIRNLRLAQAITYNRGELVLEALKHRKGCALRLTTTDRATTLRLLGEHFLGHRKDSIRAERLLGRARRIFSGEDHFDWRMGLASTDELLGLVAFRQSRLQEAMRAFDRALQGFTAVGLRPFAHRLQSTQADVHIHLAEPADAKALLREVIACWPRAREARQRIAPTVMLSHARMAVILSAENRTLDALESLRKAASALRHCDTPKYRARFLELKARALASSGKPALLRKAFAALDQAEALYLQVGDGYELGLGWVRCLRAELYVHEQRAREALEEVALCSKSRDFDTEFQLQDRVVLLKSRALLLKDVPRPDRLYEDVLGSLGVARNPVTLFRVCANLYLYSWELNDDLELTDYHLRQVNCMVEHLPVPTFRRLYVEHVTRPVFERALGRTFGLPRSSRAN